MLAGHFGRPEGDDLDIFRAIDGQTRARRNRQPRGVLMRSDIVERDDALCRAAGPGEERRQNACDSRELQGAGSQGGGGQGDGAERPLQRRREIELRIGKRRRHIEIEPRRAIDQYRRVRRGRFALIGEPKRRGATGR